MIIGIDLGTTYSAVSIMADEGPIVLPNALGERLTPSAVSLDGNELLVGAPARARATTYPTLTALSFKRDMGTERRIEIGSQSFTARELSTLVLSALKRDAEAALGERVTDAIVTVPAYFGELQRQHTREAAEMAGLRVIRLLSEPTSAALVYGRTNELHPHDVIVLDLGGGTFDVSVLQIADGEIKIRATAGDIRLGGDDFDRALAELVLAQRGADFGAPDPVTRARLVRACETAKKRLSEQETADIVLVDVRLASGRGDFQTRLEREAAERAFAPLMARMRGPIERALRDAKMTVASIDEVLLVGGATRMPWVRQMAADLFGRLPLATLPPDLAVAMGAAVQARMLEANQATSERTLVDVAPYTLGIDSTILVGKHKVTGTFTPIINRGTTLPASFTRSFSTVDDLQTSIQFDVYQGEHPQVRENTRLGGFELKGIRPRPAGETNVDVRFTYDANGLLEVEFVVVETGATETHLVESTVGRLSPEQVVAAREAMQKLKVKPREEVPNATAIARAEAAFMELTGSVRDEIGEALAMFRGALDTGDAELIAETRARLLGLTEGENAF